MLDGYRGDLKWYIVDVFGNLIPTAQTGPEAEFFPTKNTTYVAGATSGVCPEVYSGNITIVVDQPSVAGNLGVREDAGDAFNYSSITVCVGTEVELETSGSRGVVQGWFETVSGRPIEELGKPKSVNVFDSPREDTKYTVVVKNGTCPADSTSVNVKVDQRTNPGAVDAQSPICLGDDSKLKIFGQRGDIISLTEAFSGVISGFPNGDSTLTPVNDSYYVMTVKNGVCPADSVLFNIDVHMPVTLLTTDPDGFYCSNDNNGISFNLSGGDESTYKVYYSHVDQSGRIVDSASFSGTSPVLGNLPIVGGYAEGIYAFDFVASGKCVTQRFDSVRVVDPVELADVYVDPVRCYGESSGQVFIDVTKGSGDFLYTWRNVVTGEVITTLQDITLDDDNGIPIGEYSVEISDRLAVGCDFYGTIVMTQPPPLQIERTEIQDVSCDGRPEGTLCYSVTGGNDITQWGGHAYYWSKIDTNSAPADTVEVVDIRHQNCVHVLTDGIYHFVAQDGRFCPIDAVDTIRFVPVVVPDFEFALPDCDSLYTTLEVEENGEFEEWIVEPRGIITYSDTNGFVRRLDVDRITNYEYIVTRNVRNEICLSTFTDSILFRANPVVDWDFFPKKPDVLDSRVIMTNFSDRDLDYAWTMYNPLYDVIDTISHSYSTNYQFDQGDSATYPVTLYGINQLGCADSLTKPIFVNGVFRIYTPNGFSPDNDGTNDIWMPVITGIEPTDYLLEVWDRWGKKVFSTTNPDEGWDGHYGGKKLGIGTFAWRVEFRDRYTVERIIRRGAVSIVK